VLRFSTRRLVSAVAAASLATWLPAALGQGKEPAKSEVAPLPKLRAPHKAPAGKEQPLQFKPGNDWKVLPCIPVSYGGKDNVCIVDIDVLAPPSGTGSRVCTLYQPDVLWTNLNAAPADYVVWRLPSAPNAKGETFTFRFAALPADPANPSADELETFGIEILDRFDHLSTTKKAVWAYAGRSTTEVLKRIGSTTFKSSPYNTYLSFKRADGSTGNCVADDPIIINRG
jgi:hypothetical protein